MHCLAHADWQPLCCLSTWSIQDQQNQTLQGGCGIVPAGWRKTHRKSRDAGIALSFIRLVTRIGIALDELIVGFCASAIDEEITIRPISLARLVDGGSTLVAGHLLDTDRLVIRTICINEAHNVR